MEQGSKKNWREEHQMLMKVLGSVVEGAMKGKDVWPTFQGSLGQKRFTSKERFGRE